MHNAFKNKIFTLKITNNTAGKLRACMHSNKFMYVNIDVHMYVYEYECVCVNA